MNQFVPNIVKRRKFQRKLRAIRGDNLSSHLSFGDYGFRLQEGYFMPDFHFQTVLDSSKRILRALLKNKTYRIVWRYFPNRSETRKANARMGGGKGDVEFWSAGIKRLSIFVEYVNINFDAAKALFKEISAKLPVPITLVYKDENNIEKDLWRKKL